MIRNLRFRCSINVGGLGRRARGALLVTAPGYFNSPEADVDVEMDRCESPI